MKAETSQIQLVDDNQLQPGVHISQGVCAGGERAQVDIVGILSEGARDKGRAGKEGQGIDGVGEGLAEEGGRGKMMPG